MSEHPVKPVSFMVLKLLNINYVMNKLKNWNAQGRSSANGYSIRDSSLICLLTDWLRILCDEWTSFGWVASFFLVGSNKSFRHTLCCFSSWLACLTRCCSSSWLAAESPCQFWPKKTKLGSCFLRNVIAKGGFIAVGLMPSLGRAVAVTPSTSGMHVASTKPNAAQAAPWWTLTCPSPNHASSCGNAYCRWDLQLWIFL